MTGEAFRRDPLAPRPGVVEPVTMYDFDARPANPAIGLPVTGTVEAAGHVAALALLAESYPATEWALMVTPTAIDYPSPLARSGD